MTQILLIDNYDSFTYNLVQLFREIGTRVLVIRNDRISAAEAQTIDATHLVVSPGPGTPDQAGHSMDIIRQLLGKIPILGVCLGHQCLAQVMGAKLSRAPRLMHGKVSAIQHDEEGIYQDLPQQLQVGRYHSLVVDRNTLPSALEVSATSDDNQVMGLKHTDFNAQGVQFHPESVLTPKGGQILHNFLNQTGGMR